MDFYGNFGPEFLINDFYYQKLLTLRQRSTVNRYKDQFQFLQSLVSITYPDIDEAYFASCCLNGLKDEIRKVVQLFRPVTVSHVLSLAGFQESILNVEAKIKASNSANLVNEVTVDTDNNDQVNVYAKNTLAIELSSSRCATEKVDVTSDVEDQVPSLDLNDAGLQVKSNCSSQNSQSTVSVVSHKPVSLTHTVESPVEEDGESGDDGLTDVYQHHDVPESLAEITSQVLVSLRRNVENGQQEVASVDSIDEPVEVRHLHSPSIDALPTDNSSSDDQALRGSVILDSVYKVYTQGYLDLHMANWVKNKWVSEMVLVSCNMSHKPPNHQISRPGLDVCFPSSFQAHGIPLRISYQSCSYWQVRWVTSAEFYFPSEASLSFYPSWWSTVIPSNAKDRGMTNNRIYLHLETQTALKFIFEPGHIIRDVARAYTIANIEGPSSKYCQSILSHVGTSWFRQAATDKRFVTTYKSSGHYIGLMGGLISSSLSIWQIAWGVVRDTLQPPMVLYVSSEGVVGDATVHIISKSTEIRGQRIDKIGTNYNRRSSKILVICSYIFDMGMQRMQSNNSQAQLNLYLSLDANHTFSFGGYLNFVSNILVMPIGVMIRFRGRVALVAFVLGKITGKISQSILLLLCAITCSHSEKVKYEGNFDESIASALILSQVISQLQFMSCTVRMESVVEIGEGSRKFSLCVVSFALCVGVVVSSLLRMFFVGIPIVVVIIATQQCDDGFTYLLRKLPCCGSSVRNTIGYLHHATLTINACILLCQAISKSIQRKWRVQGGQNSYYVKSNYFYSKYALWQSSSCRYSVYSMRCTEDIQIVWYCTVHRMGVAVCFDPGITFQYAGSAVKSVATILAVWEKSILEIRSFVMCLIQQQVLVSPLSFSKVPTTFCPDQTVPKNTNGNVPVPIFKLWRLLLYDFGEKVEHTGQTMHSVTAVGFLILPCYSKALPYALCEERVESSQRLKPGSVSSSNGILYIGMGLCFSITFLKLEEHNTYIQLLLFSHTSDIVAPVLRFHACIQVLKVIYSLMCFDPGIIYHNAHLVVMIVELPVRGQDTIIYKYLSSDNFSFRWSSDSRQTLGEYPLLGWRVGFTMVHISQGVDSPNVYGQVHVPTGSGLVLRIVFSVGTLDILLLILPPGAQILLALVGDLLMESGTNCVKATELMFSFLSCAFQAVRLCSLMTGHLFFGAVVKNLLYRVSLKLTDLQEGCLPNTLVLGSNPGLLVICFVWLGQCTLFFQLKEFNYKVMTGLQQMVIGNRSPVRLEVIIFSSSHYFPLGYLSSTWLYERRDTIIAFLSRSFYHSPCCLYDVCTRDIFVLVLGYSMLFLSCEFICQCKVNLFLAISILVPIFRSQYFLHKVLEFFLLGLEDKANFKKWGLSCQGYSRN